LHKYPVQLHLENANLSLSSKFNTPCTTQDVIRTAIALTRDGGEAGVISLPSGSRTFVSVE
jgi:hypothetical protein